MAGTYIGGGYSENHHSTEEPNLGRYSRDCFEFGFINDVEFAMEREMFSVECDKGQAFVKKWIIGNQFKTQWNVE